MTRARIEVPSGRAVSIRLAVYLAFFLGAASAFAATPSSGNFNYSGTVIFGTSVSAETTTIYRSNLLEDPGAVTVTSDWSSRTAITGNTFQADLISDLPDSSGRIVSSSASAPPTLSRENAEGMNALQIALGDENWIAGDITPVPEAPTWWAAALVAGFVGWSQWRTAGRKLSGQPVPSAISQRRANSILQKSC